MTAAIRGLYGIVDAGGRADPEQLTAWMLAGGCRLLQLRCKGWPPGEVARLARALVPRCRASGARLIVNDLPEVAVEAGADGAHLGQLDAPTDAARAVLGPGRILGRSTNTLEQLATTWPGSDYVAFGPVFPTSNLSRPKEVQGLAQLARARALLPRDLPLVAIGGITAATVEAVRAAGADAWAVIGAVADAADPVAATRSLLDERSVTREGD